jgi:hypothetical protein
VTASSGKRYHYELQDQPFMSQFPASESPSGSPNPFAAAPPSYPPPQKSNVWLWVLFGAGGAAVLVCCGCGGLMWFGWSVSTSVLGDQMVRQLNADAIAQQELGTVSSASFDVMASGQASQGAKGKSILVFRVVGDKASGEVHAEQAPNQDKMFQNAKLVLPGGKEVQLGF